MGYAESLLLREIIDLSMKIKSIEDDIVEGSVSLDFQWPLEFLTEEKESCENALIKLGVF